MAVFKSKIYETSTTTGTGTFTLDGAKSPDFQAFDNSLQDGDSVSYTIDLPGASQWEVGKGTFKSPDKLERTNVEESTAIGNTKVNFNSGTKQVYLVMTATDVDTAVNQTLKKSGGTLTGNLDLNNNDIKNSNIDNSNTITVLDSDFTVQNSSDNSKQIDLDLSGLTTSTTRTLTVPDVSDTLAVLNTNQTFSATQTFTGTVDLSSATISGVTTDDVSEASNLYFTTGRVDSHLSGGTGINYSTGTISIDSTVVQTTDTDVSGNSWVLDEDSFGSNSNTKLATQQSIKSYVDSVQQGLEVKDSVRVGTDGTNIDLTSATDPNPIDDITLSNGDRILLKDQTDASENGIYVANTATDPTTWTRSLDADEDSEVNSGLYVFIEEGTNNGSNGYALTTNDPITVGTTDLNFTQFSGVGQIDAGTGLDKVGNTLSIDADISNLNNVATPNTFTAGQVLIYHDTNGQFENSTLTSGSGITVSNADASITVFADEANIDHDSLQNFVSNEHIDHSGVTVTGGAGLTGGGDLTSSRTIDIDIDGQTQVTAATNDKIIISDESDSNNIKKITAQSIADLVAATNVDIDAFATLLTPNTNDELLLSDTSDNSTEKKSTVSRVVNLADHNQLTNFVTNEHIDHSNVNINAGDGLSGGGDLTSSRTINIDINGQTEVSAGSDDEIIITDASNSNLIRKIKARSISKLDTEVDTSLSDQTGYLVTTSLADAYTAPSSSVFKYVVKSIHLVNLSEVDETITAEIDIDGGGNFSLGNTLPLPGGSAVELLKRIKVLNPNDAIRLQASNNNAAQAWITVSQYENTDLFVSGVDLTTNTITDVYTSTSNPSAVESILVSNDGANSEKITIEWTDGNNNVQGYAVFKMPIGPSSTVELLEGPKRMPAGHKIRAKAESANVFEVLVSGEQIT